MRVLLEVRVAALAMALMMVLAVVNVSVENAVVNLVSLGRIRCVSMRPLYIRAEDGRIIQSNRVLYESEKQIRVTPFPFRLKTRKGCRQKDQGQVIKGMLRKTSRAKRGGVLKKTKERKGMKKTECDTCKRDGRREGC